MWKGGRHTRRRKSISKKRLQGHSWLDDGRQAAGLEGSREQIVEEVASGLAQAASKAAVVARQSLPIDASDVQQEAEARRGVGVPPLFGCSCRGAPLAQKFGCPARMV